MPLPAFVRLSRLKFLLGGFVTGALGTAIAAYETGRVNAGAYALAQATITSLHLMTHYANDYFDRNSDVTAIRTPYSGGSGTLVDGTFSPAVALGAAAACAALGLAGSIGLTALGLPAAALAAVAIFVGAWIYSAPPLRLAARGLGEADAALVVAALVPLCAFLAQRAAVDGRFIGSLLPGVAAMFALMLAVEAPDLAADARSGKRNLAVRLGPRRARLLGAACVIGTFAAFGAALWLQAPPLYGVAALAALPLGLPLIRAFLAWRAAVYGDSGRLAARGVAFFFLVVLFSLAAYAGALPARHNATVACTATVRKT